MSTGMPELGSKISLISKADIRYEGRLFTVDPQECTIALASVRSFGTEDRETQYPVAPQNQVYDYILFRGSDIKDIRVVNNVSTLPNDPAIMQLSVPPSLGQQQYQPPAFSHPVLGPMGPQIPQNYNPYGSLGNMGGLPNQLAPGMNINRDMRNMPKQSSSELLNNVLSGPIQTQPDLSTNQQRPNENASVLDLIGGGSRSTTPVSLSSRKSPTMDAGVQAGASGDRKGHHNKAVQPPEKRGERKDSQGDRQMNDNRQNRQQRDNRQPQQNRGGWNNRGNMRQRGNRGRGSGGNMYQHRQNQHHPNNQRNYHPNNQNQQGQNQQGPKPKNTLKFDNDYDFEQANTEFEELRSKLAKTKISDDGAQTKLEVNGDSEKKDDSGNETGAGEQEPEEDQEVYYDKAKSFFDNISCEAVERSKGRSQRTDWRKERKLNTETFGVSSARRGGYRGRGGYYRGGFRGGYRGNYRGGQNRQNNMQRSNNQQGEQRDSQSNGQSSSSQPPPSQPATQTASAGK